MPTINIYKWRLLNELKISETQLEDLLFNLKSEMKPIDQDHIEIEINNDRPDLLFVYGIIRSIKGLLKKELGEPRYSVKDTDYVFEIKEVPSRPYALAAVVEDIKFDDELLKELIQFQEKLHITVGRKRKKIAIGLHDLKKIDSKHIIYTTVNLDYKFIPLNSDKEMSVREILESTPQGKEYGNISLLDGKMPAIMQDDGQILSLPPVINSEKTRINSKTQSLFIDVTGTSLDTVIFTLDVIVTNLAEMGGKIGRIKVISPYVDNSPLLQHKSIKITAEYINKILGTNLNKNEIIEYLKMARFDVNDLGKEIEVIIPPYRNDILSQIDITEEVAITYGYNNLSPTPYKIEKIGSLSDRTKLIRVLRDLSVGGGFTEIFTFTLISESLLLGDFVKILNPITVDYNSVRNSLLPSILIFLSKNQHARMPIRVFEIGDVVIRNENTETGYSNKLNAAYAIMNSRVSFEELQAPLHEILNSLGINPIYKRDTNPLFIEGRTASIYANNKKIGIIGEINPNILEKIDIEYPIVMSEIYLDEIKDIL
ncbi:phenylalanine--tRNA ligase subunit beta [Sulfurisphaera tokodaii]|uniref:Phenylalanine--tRNA ligase beta subunit n=2 Tax=Sulfurisphaera tokodaii TaxID=111955 RepID=SYFB_SULTO|nr:phenylalanine--tRNA ligase subunit beta [Sulfurisphaera tokodaii]Q971D8.1 RecName: Full=Phenylalanine--tRNA ligase beta subunit; AltName: Full=Phenylalanyl-tRNA synthetase beta subunit; Short=PheRS [Sulfurisphaera tokodaii str. 7]BAK54561.1 phenylalanyl-tRNA synthetase beta chain [Sulfurisphaera tokodaii str. 7]HII73702.1 phenylalanine--tRNA ligase subunit beta [Sulfurisphaera tokodaii]